MSVKRYSVWEDEMFEEKHAINSTNGMVHLMVKHEDYAALEARCAALTAENALMKKSEPAPFSKLMMEVLDVYQAGADEVPELAMLSAYKKLRDGLKTPATDAFLAEVRAQGVEMFVAHKRERQQALRSRSMRMSEEAAGMAADAENFADELRKGVQS